MSFDERKLRAIVAVADSGSLGRAADVVNLSQPALSRIIHDMEVRFGYPLFERHTKGMIPTSAGEILVGYARQLVFDMQQAREALSEPSGPRRGCARIGAVAAANCSVVSEAINALTTRSPQLTFEVFEAPDGELVDALAERRIDLMVGSDLIVHDAIRALGHCGTGDHFAVCCSNRTARSLPPCPVLIDVLHRRWVMLQKGRTPRQRFEDLVSRAEFACPEIAIETNSTGAQIALIQATDLLGWLPAAVIRDQLANGSLVTLHIPELAMSRRFRIYRRTMGFLSRPAEMLLAQLERNAADRTADTS